MTAALIYFNGGNRGRDFLDQSQLFFPVAFICMIDQIF